MTRYDRAEQAAASGYRVTLAGPDTYIVHRPQGGSYRVTNGHCNCPATVACKHTLLVADAILDQAYKADARATAEMEWTGCVSRFTAAGLRFRAEAVRLYDLAQVVRFGVDAVTA